LTSEHGFYANWRGLFKINHTVKAKEKQDVIVFVDFMRDDTENGTNAAGLKEWFGRAIRGNAGKSLDTVVRYQP
jgi:hypothetical protein